MEVRETGQGSGRDRAGVRERQGRCQRNRAGVRDRAGVRARQVGVRQGGDQRETDRNKHNIYTEWETQRTNTETQRKTEHHCKRVKI